MRRCPRQGPPSSAALRSRAAVARDADGEARTRDHRGHRPRVRTRRVPATSRASRSGSRPSGPSWGWTGTPPASPRACSAPSSVGLRPCAGSSALHVCGGRGADSRKTPGELIALGDRSGLDGGAGAREPAGREGRQRRRAGRLRPLPSRIRRRRGRPMGRRAAGHARRGAHGSPLSLAERSSGNLRRRTAYRDRRPSANRANRQSHRLESRRRRTAQLRSCEKVRSVARAVRARAGVAEQGTGSEPGPDPTPFITTCAPRTFSVSACTRCRPPHTRAPVDFADLLLVPGVGARTVFALALVGEVVYGAPSRFSDPARFSLAHGGKDGHPYPVPLRSTTRRSASSRLQSRVPRSATTIGSRPFAVSMQRRADWTGVRERSTSRPLLRTNASNLRHAVG